MKSSLSFRLVSLLCFVLPAALPAADYMASRTDTYTRVGGLLSFVMPAVAFGATAYMKDGEGAWQVTKSMAVTGVITLGFKYSVRSRRPNGDPYSFPSGHAAFAMASAQFLGQRYGWEYGVPAYVLAAFSAHSRVWAHEHYLKDVAAGTVIGIVSTYFFTTPYHGWHVRPEFSGGAGSLKLSRSF